ncbi:MAG: hypothetical protein RhofKO_43740 [Rhodothermales bacterium]
MPYTLHISPEQRLIEQRFWGHLTLSESLRAIHTLWHHPAYNRHYRGVFDIRMASLTFNTTDMVTLTKDIWNDPRYLLGDMAIVVTAPIPTALAMLYASRSREHRVRAFSSPEPARQWVLRSTRHTSAPLLHAPA